MKVIEKINKYPRKNTEHSVWIAADDVPDKVRGIEIAGHEKLIFCAHPVTDPERAHVIAQMWKIALATPEGQKLIEQAVKDGF